MEFKQQLISRYQYLFVEQEEVVTDDLSFMGISEEQAFAEEMGWYPLLVIAAGDKYLSIEAVTKSPLVEFFTYINFYKRKSELDHNRIKRSQQNTHNN